MNENKESNNNDELVNLLMAIILIFVFFFLGLAKGKRVGYEDGVKAGKIELLETQQREYIQKKEKYRIDSIIKLKLRGKIRRLEDDQY